MINNSIQYIKELLLYLFSNSNESNSMTYEEAMFISNTNNSNNTNNKNKKTNKEIEMTIIERQK